MKIKNEYPMYIALQNGNIFEYKFDNALMERYKPEMCMEIATRMTLCFKSIVEHFYVTDSFYDAFTKAIPKMGVISENAVAKVKCNSRLFLHNNGFAMHHSETVNGVEFCEFYIFSKIALVGYGLVQSKYDPLTKETQYRGDGFMSSPVDEEPNSLFLALWANYMTLIVFMEECEIEKKVVESSKKFRDKGSKIYNDTKKSITFLDCRWFTELVRTTPFSVNGHLRWQPCGEGRTKKKLIWIEPFEKHGYHRKATKELQTS